MTYIKLGDTWYKFEEINGECFLTAVEPLPSPSGGE